MIDRRGSTRIRRICLQRATLVLAAVLVAGAVATTVNGFWSCELDSAEPRNLLVSEGYGGSASQLAGVRGAPDSSGLLIRRSHLRWGPLERLVPAIVWEPLGVPQLRYVIQATGTGRQGRVCEEVSQQEALTHLERVLYQLSEREASIADFERRLTEVERHVFNR